MKNFSSLLLIITFASHFGIIEMFAQKQAKPKEVIIVVFSYSADYSFDGLEFPINKTAKGKFDAGGGMVSECGFPEKPECANFIYSSYEISGKAFAAGKNQVKIKLKGEITVDVNDCRINGIYTVYRNRKTKIRFNSCGANLIFYYGLKSKKAN
jgi:flagellar basal body L-ring protein FlgH